MIRGFWQFGSSWRVGRSKWLLRGVLFALLAPGMRVDATAAAAQGPEPVSIEIGNLATYAFANEWLDYEIAAFRRAHPHIQVRALPYAEPDRDDYPLHKNPFLPRNIIGLDSHEGAEAVYLAEKGEIVPIDDFLPDPGFSKSQFYDSYWDSVSYGGKIWGVPWQVWTDVIVCDMEIFEAAGISEPPKTIEEMIAMIPKLTNLEAEPEVFGFRSSTKTHCLLNLLLTLVLQQGGHVMQDNQFKEFDPALLSSLQIMKRLLLDTPSVNLHGANIARLEFPDRHFAMQFVQPRHVGAILGQKKFRIIPLPTLTNDQFVCSRRLYLSVRRSTPAEERASWELVKWLVREDVSVPKAPLGYPCRKDIVARPEFKALAEKGPEGLEVLFTSAEAGRDLGPFVLNRGRALSQWAGQLLFLLGDETDYERTMARAAKAANRVLLPLPDYKASGKKSLSIYE